MAAIQIPEELAKLHFFSYTTIPLLLLLLSLFCYLRRQKKSFDI